MDSQELLNICIYVTVGIFAIAFLLDLIVLMVRCWKEVTQSSEELKEATQTEQVSTISEELDPKASTASIDCVQPCDETETAENINIVQIAKSKIVATSEQLTQLPIKTLKAIAKSKQIRLGNSKKDTIVKKLQGFVTVSDITTIT